MAEQDLRIPYDKNSEEAILGSIILENKYMNRAGEYLTPDDFYVNSNKEIYSAMETLATMGQPIDITILTDRLQKDGKLEVSGGSARLLDLTSGTFYTSNFDEYVEIVKEKSTLRKLINAAKEIESEARSQKDSVDVVLANAETSIYNITQDDSKDGLTRLSFSVDEAFKKMTDAMQSGDDLTGLSSGFIDLDRQLSGFQNSDLVLIAARPSVGKTALGLNIALNVALKGYKVAVFSLEMSKVQLTQRLFSIVSEVNLQNIISGEIQNDLQQINTAGGILKKLELYIDDTSGMTMTEIRSKTRRMKAEKGLDFIMIDYIQLMEGDRRSENRQQEIAGISRGLKGLAKELNIPILGLSQLSRDSEKRSTKDKKPQMSDIRESGAIEQDCDVVILLHRDDYYNEDSEKPNIIELNIAKHRNGPTGTVELFFKKELTAFKNLGKEQASNGF